MVLNEMERGLHGLSGQTRTFKINPRLSASLVRVVRVPFYFPKNEAM